jgi:2-dehydropantoate 2-reductase
MKIVVIGAGAIGGFVGGKLAASGQDVTFVDRAPFAEAVQTKGLRIIEPGGKTATLHPTVATQLADAFTGSSPADLALLCVKSFDTQAAVDELRPHRAGFRHILSLQNGISNEDILSQAFGADKVIAGTITHPVVVTELGAVRSEKKKGGIGVALVNGQNAASWADLINKAGIVTRAYADYRAMKWSKLLLNLIGNATSAVLNMNTVRVFADRRLVWLEVEQLREAIAVMDKLKIRPVSLPGYPVPLLVMTLRTLPTLLLGPIMRPLVVRGRAEKLPSLLIELNRKSGKSEVDEINGAVAQVGQSVGVATPVNATLAATVNLLTQLPAQREAWNENVERLVLVVRAARRELPPLSHTSSS